MPAVAPPLNLLFHVVAGPEGCRAAPAVTTSQTALGDRLEGLLRQGLRPAALDAYLGSAPPSAETFTVSFDDAHPSLIDLAAPVLAELSVPATVFVPTASVGETDRVMGWSAVRALSRARGWTVGSHGALHELMSWRIYDETEAAQLDRLTQGALASRQAIEAALGSPPSLFAYPFGQAPPAAREAVRRAGYGAAFTVGGPGEPWDGDLFGVPRIDGGAAAEGEEEDDVPGLTVVVPACDRPALLAEVVRRLSLQSYPSDRHEVIVVDDGSSADLTEALAPYLGERVRLLRLPDSGGTFRAGRARQAGAEAARFEVLVFLDADVAVDQDFLWHVAYCHGQGSRGTVALGYLSGYNLHDLGFVHDLDEIRAAPRLVAEEVPVIRDRSREPALRGCLDDVHALDEPWRLAYTGNLSVSRELFFEVGGFCQDFSGWGFEDVDLGVGLHEAGASWVFSRFALGYHLDEGACQPPSNPFRDPSPRRERFVPVLDNLARLEARHPGHEGVAAFAAQVRADVEETCDPPEVVGVEVGAAYPFEWPFRRLHAPWPGGLSLEEILDRLAYAEKIGASHLYLLGGDVALRPELPRVLEAARAGGESRVTMETTALPLSQPGLAGLLASCGLSAAAVEILVGQGHPTASPELAAGVAALRDAGVEVGAKLVVAESDGEALDRALELARSLGMPPWSVVALGDEVAEWARSRINEEVEVEVA